MADRTRSSKSPERDSLSPESSSQSSKSQERIINNDFTRHWSNLADKNQQALSSQRDHDTQPDYKQPHESDLKDSSVLKGMETLSETRFYESFTSPDERKSMQEELKRLRSLSMEKENNEIKKLRQDITKNTEESENTSPNHLYYTPGLLREIFNNPEETKKNERESIKQVFNVDPKNDPFDSINNTVDDINKYINDTVDVLDRFTEISQNLLKEITSDTKGLSTRGLLDTQQKLSKNLNNVADFLDKDEEYERECTSLQNECSDVIEKYREIAQESENKLRKEHWSRHLSLSRELRQIREDLAKNEKKMDKGRITEQEYNDAKEELNRNRTRDEHDQDTLERTDKPKEINEVRVQYLRNYSNARKYYKLKEYNLAIERCLEQQLHTDSLRNAYTDLSQINTRIRQYQGTITNINDENLRQYLSNPENEVAAAIDNLVTFSQHFRNPSDREIRTIQNTEHRLSEVLSTAQRSPVNLRERLDELNTTTQELEQLIRNRVKAESKKKRKGKAD